MGFSPFSAGGTDDDLFDDADSFVPGHLPGPGEFLSGHDVLTGRDHVAFHRLTRDLFEERAVYDMTFGYNLARLNLDTRHPDAGFRYAVDAEDPGVLRAEFTPTTPFCPQSHTLTLGAFRAWNGLSERHEYDLVAVRVDAMHNEAVAINGELKQVEREYERSGAVPGDVGGDRPDGRVESPLDAFDARR
ncbi:MAG: hypothetical protein ABEJ06_01735 [Haloarculaceae archaeon]